MLGGAVSSAIDHVVTPYLVTETFDGHNKPIPELQKMTGKTAVVAFLTLVVIFFLLLLVGKFLWNEVLIVLMPFIKPASSIWQILGLAVLTSLVVPGCNCVQMTA